MAWERDAAGNIVRDAIGNPVADAGGPEPGSICWGHTTAIEESVWKPFITNWTGDGAITGSGDAEAIELVVGEERISETWEIGVGRVRLIIDKYGTGEGVPASFQYKQGNSQINCEADSWHNYTVPFLCSGWVKIRVAA